MKIKGERRLKGDKKINGGEIQINLKNEKELKENIMYKR